MHAIHSTLASVIWTIMIQKIFYSFTSAMTVELIYQATSKRGHIIAIHVANLYLASYNVTYRSWEKFGLGKIWPGKKFVNVLPASYLATSLFSIQAVHSQSPMFYPPVRSD